jgi:excisionase family DNA binding protein
MNDELIAAWNEIAAEWRKVQAAQDALEAERAGGERSEATELSVTGSHQRQETPTTSETVAEAPSVPENHERQKPPQGALLAESEVADRLSCSVSTVRRLRSAGELPAVKVGKRGVRYLEADVTDYVAQNYG